MESYRANVLSDRYRDPKTGRYNYPHRISKAEVLRIANVKSRATLLAAHHQDLAAMLDKFIDDLKREVGKGAGSEPKPSADVTENIDRRLNEMAQSLFAAQYRIIALEQELSARPRHGTNVVSNLTPSRAKKVR